MFHGVYYNTKVVNVFYVSKLVHHLNSCDISGTQGGKDVDVGLLEYNSMWSCRRIRTVQTEAVKFLLNVDITYKSP